MACLVAYPQASEPLVSVYSTVPYTELACPLYQAFGARKFCCTFAPPPPPPPGTGARGGPGCISPSLSSVTTSTYTKRAPPHTKRTPPPPAMAPGETLLVNGEQMSYERLLEEFGDPARTIGREVLAGCPQNLSHPWVQGCISCGCMSKATRYAVRVDERWDCVGCYVNGFIHMKRGLAPGKPIKPAP